MKSLVTGGSGFLGAQLCMELISSNHEVVVLDNFSRSTKERLLAKNLNIQFIEGDVCDYQSVKNALKGCDYLWHLAFINGTRFFYEKPDLVLEVGLKGALNTIEAALDLGIKRYVLASSSETYNEPEQIPTNENERLVIPDILNPRFSYGGGKIASELLAIHFGARRGLDTVIFRPHNFIGPNMGFEHVIPELVKKIIIKSEYLKLKKVQLKIQGNGQETRSFCDVRDGANGSLIAGLKGLNSNIYHVGTQNEVKIIDLIKEISNCLGIQIEILPGEIMKGGTLRRCPDISKLKKLGYSPQFSFSQSVRRCVDWYKNYYLKNK